MIQKMKALCLEPFYQCHVDGELGGCVLDDERPWDCFYTEGEEPRLTDKRECRHWKPVEPNPHVAAVLGPLAAEIFAVLESASETSEYGLTPKLKSAVDALNAKASCILDGA